MKIIRESLRSIISDDFKKGLTTQKHIKLLVATFGKKIGM